MLGTFITKVKRNMILMKNLLRISEVILLILSIILIHSCKKLETPTVTTTGISDITKVSAKSGGNVIFDGGEMVSVRGVCWSTTTDPTINDNKTSDGAGEGVFTSSVTNLNAGTLYYLRAYATSKSGTGYGATITFTTQPATQAILSTAIVTDVTKTLATSGGTITYDGASTITERGICWSTSQNPTISDNKTSNGNGIGSFVSSITGLTQGTNYYVRAYASNSVGTAYGSQVNFTTLTIPTVTTTAISGIAQSTAISGGNVTSTGGSAVTARGVCWSLTLNPTVADNEIYFVISGGGTGAFACSITGLSLGSTYYVGAFATNSIGTAYGSEISFKASLALWDNYQGGKVGLLKSWGHWLHQSKSHGLIIALTDQSTSASWGCMGTLINGTSRDIGTGANNTSIIISACPTSGIAAKLCTDLVIDGYDDWYLPSVEELNRINLDHSTSPIYYHTYWSSSQYNFTTPAGYNNNEAYTVTGNGNSPWKNQ